MLQHPVQIVLTGTGQPVRVIIAGIVLPESIIQRLDPLPIEGDEDVLVGEKHFFFMLRYIPEDLLCGDGTSAFLQIHQQDAGVIVIVIGPQADAVDTVGKLCLSGVCSCCEKMCAEIQFPERPQGIDDQYIGI